MMSHAAPSKSVPGIALISDPGRWIRSFSRMQFLILSLLMVLGSSSLARAQFDGPSLTVTPTLNTDRLLPGSQHVLALTFKVPAGLHAQSATPTDDFYIPLTIKVTNLPPGVTALAPVYPKGEEKNYPLLGKLNIYEGTVTAFVPLTVSADLAPDTQITLQGKVSAQMCNDESCFPPSDTSFKVTTTVAPRDATLKSADPAIFKTFDWSVFSKGNLPTAPPSGPTTKKSDVSIFGFTLDSDSYTLAFTAASLVGLLFNIMPCVLPVLPLKAVGFIEAAERSRARAIALGLVFSGGLVAVFAILGLAIFLGGKQWGFLFQSHLFILVMTVVLVAMALYQWGLFAVRLPMGAYTYEPRHDTYSGSFFFGAFTALLSTPCTAPVFPALLLWGAAQPNKLVGVAMMISVGIGMALPYFVLSCFPELARKVPRTGAWSEIFKQMMGFLILATAGYFAGQALLPGMKFMYVVSAIAIAASLFLIVRTIRLMPRPVPIVVATLLAVLLSTSSLYATNRLNQKPVEWTHFSDEALAAARAHNQTVLVKFTANWCANCHYVEATVFTDAKVKSALASKDVLLLKVDLTNADAPGSELLKSLNPAGGIPLTAIYFPGKEQPLQLTSIYTPTTLLSTLAAN